MATASLDKSVYTLNRREPVQLTLSTQSSTPTQHVTANYSAGSVVLLQTASGPNRIVDLKAHVARLIKRELPIAGAGVTVDESATVAFQADVSETLYNAETCSDTQGATALSGDAVLLDSLLPSALYLGARLMDERGDVTLPTFEAPTPLYIWAESQTGLSVELQPSRLINQDPEITQYTLTEKRVSMVHLLTRDPERKQIVYFGGKNYTIRFSECLQHLMIAKTQGGSFVPFAFDRMVTQPSQQVESVRAYPESEATRQRPLKGDGRSSRSLSLRRDKFFGSERATARAFAQGLQYWYWQREVGQYVPVATSGITSIADRTTSLSLTITFDVD